VKTRTRWIIVAAYAGMIFAFSSISKGPTGAQAIPGLDKILHFGVYFVFSWLIYAALRASGVSRARAAVMAMALASIYGITDEIHQRYVPNRTASVADWAADTLGAGLMTVLVLTRKKEN
jgi:VanZ family protein